ncbi:hypothetical protein DOR57_23045, partial [Salmonella enterica subsp. salamae]|nr:hypothetical protein [Salmonella enterica subsp. salamae]
MRQWLRSGLAPLRAVSSNRLTSSGVRNLRFCIKHSGNKKREKRTYRQEKPPILRQCRKNRRKKNSITCATWRGGITFPELRRSGLFLKKIMSEITPLMEWIEHNLHRKITLQEIARKSGYTSRHLYNLFMDYPGVSPSTYIRQRKLSLASVMLRDTRRPVTEIALMYG